MRWSRDRLPWWARSGEQLAKAGDGNEQPWLFSQILRITRHWLAECVECQDDTFPQLLVITEKAHDAAERIHRAIVRKSGGESRLLPILRPQGTTGTTADVDFDTDSGAWRITLENDDVKMLRDTSKVVLAGNPEPAISKAIVAGVLIIDLTNEIGGRKGVEITGNVISMAIVVTPKGSSIGVYASVDSGASGMMWTNTPTDRSSVAGSRPSAAQAASIAARNNGARSTWFRVPCSAVNMTFQQSA